MLRGQGWIVLRALFWVAIGSGPAFVCSTHARAGEWALPDSRLGIRTAPLLLLSRPDVQADLRLDREQILGAQVTINELTRRAQALRGRTGAAVIAERRAIDEAQLEWLGKHLTGNQLERLRQVELQWEGVSAMLSRPTIAEYLKLMPEQRQALARVIAEQNAARKRAPASVTDDRAFTRKAQSLLSPTQRDLWNNLLGTPVRFASTVAPARSRDDAAQQAGHVQPRP
jgi:hypothetical protein